MNNVEAAECAVEGVKAKIEKLQAHLAGAKDSLANAQADLKTAKANPDPANDESGESVEAHAAPAEGSGGAYA